VARRFRLLSARDWAGLCLTVLDRESWQRLAGVIERQTGAAETQIGRLRPLEGCATIAEFANRVVEDSLT
jgi:hypothetical protein